MPRRPDSSRLGLGPWFGLWPTHSPNHRAAGFAFQLNGEAEPHRTSDGRAAPTGPN